MMKTINHSKFFAKLLALLLIFGSCPLYAASSQDFDVVIAPAAGYDFKTGVSGTSVTFNGGSGVQLGQGVIPMGSQFQGVGLVFAGSMAPTGPFVNGQFGAILNANNAIGTWSCNGGLIKPTTFAVTSPAAANDYIAASTIQFHFGNQPGINSASDYSVFLLDTFKTFYYPPLAGAAGGTGLPVRITKAVVSGGLAGLGLQNPLLILNPVSITTYVDQYGAVLFHFRFGKAVVYNDEK